jgi:serine/threonine protein kinase
LGKGSFGSVLEAYDYQTDTLVAIKIVRMKPGTTLHSNNEVNNLKKLSLIDQDNSLFVAILDYFEEHGILCIVMELLHKTLLQYLLEVKRLSISEIIPIAQQLFRALQIMQSQSLVHCDLKPENIMVQVSNKTTIKIVDLGSSCESGKVVFKFVQSRFYRAPEVTLRLEYGPAIDIWSAACIVAELYMGSPLFLSKSDTSQMVFAI